MAAATIPEPVKVTVRLPEALLIQIRNHARQKHRTAPAQILHILERHYDVRQASITVSAP